MLTAMTEDDWAIVLQVFRAVRSRRGDKGRDGNRGKFPGEWGSQGFENMI